MIGIDAQILLIAEQVFDELVRRPYRLESVERDRVLHPRIVGIKGDNILNAHLHKFLQSDGAVEGFPAGTLVLPAFIKERHDHVDPSGFSSYRGDDALQILIVVIRGHVIFVSAEGIGQAVVHNINENVEIHAANGFQNDTLGFACSKPRNFAL